MGVIGRGSSFPYSLFATYYSLFSDRLFTMEMR
jgi:hypothetical protein